MTPIQPAQIDALMPFLDKFEEAEFSAGTWEIEEGDSPWFNFDEGVMEFVQVLYDNDWRETGLDGEPAAEFRFAGRDEMTPISGGRWAIFNGSTLDGMIFVHQGDESGFTAKRGRL